MARSQNSWGLKFVLAAIALLFCLAITTVEARSVPFVAQLTPENTGKVNSKNTEYAGQAFVYLATAGREFRLSGLVVANIDTKDVINVQLYNVADEELVDSVVFKWIDEGYYAFDARISAELGANINIENIAVYVYTESIGTKRPALSGLLLNNRYTFLSLLKASEEVTTPTGTKQNVGFATIVASTTDFNTYTLNIVVNHDLDQRVTSIHLHAPAASNTNNAIVVDFPDFLQNAARVVDVTVNSTVFSWLRSDLGYVNIHTSKNTAGALRGQVIPTVSVRKAAPTFVNKATQNGITFLADGSTITGDVGLNLKQGSARNYTGDREDPRVAVFRPAVGGSFDNDFRFALPVTIKNKYSLRQIDVLFNVAAEVADNEKWTLAPLNLATLTVETGYPAAPGLGRRRFNFLRGTFPASTFPVYLGPGGIFFNVQASDTTALYVDQFFVYFYVNNAYANNILKSFFYSGSVAE